MILNPTHEITLSGLPAEVLNAYVRYKKGSRAIVKWLVQYGPTKYKSKKTLPIKELAALARRVTASIEQLPDVIHFHFKETIAARKCLSRYFRENRDPSNEEFDTINHEHFTNSLSQIYEELCQQCCYSSKIQVQTFQIEHVPLSTKLHNHYDCLPVEGADMVDDDAIKSDAECVECVEDLPTPCLTPKLDIQLEGDEMASAVETLVLLNRAQVIYDTTAACWEDAGRGNVSFVAAANITNTAWTSLRDVDTQLKAAHSELTLTVVHRTICLFKEQAEDLAGVSSRLSNHALLCALEDAERSIRHYVGGHTLRAIPSCASCVQKPADYIQLPQETAIKSDTNFQIALLDNMLHLMNRASHCPTLVLSSTPCLAEIGYLMTHLHDKADLFQCTLAVHLLTTTYRAYLSACPKPSTVALCRVSALKLANQGVSMIGKILSDKVAFPCHCPQTIAYHLSNFQHDLQSYAKFNCWDLYFQSPWIAGTQITEMLDVLSYYGMRLFHYRHYVGAVLHTYNIVQQLGGLDPIHGFDRVCEMFKDVFFPAGGRPSSSFKNSWSRFVGARLKFKRSHKGHNHRESWCMAVPAHAARTAAGYGTDVEQDRLEPKFNYGNIDPLIKLKQQGYRTRGAEGFQGKATTTTMAEFKTSSSPSLSRPSSSLSAPSLTWSDSNRSSNADANSRDSTTIVDDDMTGAVQTQDYFCDQYDSHPLSNLLVELNTSISSPSNTATKITYPAESTSSILPSSRLNLLAIFQTSLTLVSKVSERVHTNPEEKATKNCVCFVTTLLSAADRIVEARRLGRLEAWRKDEREVIEILGEEIKAVAGAIEKDWLWDF